MPMQLTDTVILTVALLGVACSTKVGARESTVQGTVALSTFASAPSAVAARDESGRLVRAAIDAQGRFVLPIASSHSYRLNLEAPGQSTPIVFPRASGRLDASFVLKTNGASVRLGQVRHYAGAPAGGFRVFAAKAVTPPGSDCVDCVNDDQQVTCDDAVQASGSSANSGSDTAEQADASAELAVGDRNAPEQVEGCDSEDGDNVEQEGEH